MSKPLTLADKLYALSQENAKKYQEPAQPTPTKAATPTQPQETAEEKAARERFETSMRLNSLNNTLSGMQFQETAEELDQAFGDIRSKAKNHLGLDIPPAQYNIVADKITGKSKAEEAEPPQLETNPFSYSIGDAAKRMHEFNEATKKYEEDTKQYRDFAEQANELVTPEKESFWEKLARLGAGIASPTTGAAFTTNIPSKKTEPHYTERLDQATKDYVATLEYDEDGKVIVDGLAIPEEDVLRSLSPSVEGAAYPTLMRDINYRDDQAKRQGYASWNDLIDATYGARLAAIKENVMAEEVKGGGRNSFYTLFREEAAGSRAVRNLEDTIDAMKKGTFWSGFDEGFDTRSALTFGLTGLFSDIDLLRVQNKAKDGVPLTRQEQNILDLFAIKQDLEDVDKLTGVTSARSIGQSVGYTTELMAQFPLAMNLAGGITKAIPMLATNSLKGSARWAVTRRAFQHGVMKGIAKGTSNLLGMGGTALLNLGKMQVVGGIASLAMPSTYANYVQARQKQFTIKDGKLTYTPTSAWTDFYNTIIDSSSEIASELAGQYIQNIADLTFGKFGRMLGLNLIRPSAAWRKVTQDLSFSGMVGEPLSEIWGDITSNVLKMGITGDGDLSMLSDPEYWKKAFAVSMIYGGGMTLASVPSRIMTYTQIQDLGKQKKELLAKVEEQDLYDELVMLSTDESVTQAAQRLAKFFAGKRAKGEKITTDQLAVAMDYIRTEAVLQVAMGINEQSEYMGEFSKAAEGLVARVYCGEDGTTPHRAIVQVTDSTTGKTYDVVSGNVKDVTTGDDLLMVRDADGNKMTLAKGKNLKKSVKNLDTLIAEEFESMFSMPSALDKIAKAEVAYEQLENPTREKVLEMMKGLGIEVPHEGKILELADGRKVTFVEINERGEFIVEHKGADGITSEMLVAPFTQIISSADHIAQAQRHIAGQKIVDMARKEIIAEEVAESTPETTTEATTPTEVTTPQTGAKHKVGEIIDTPNGKARVVAIEGGSYVVDFNLANTSFDDEVMEHGEYSIEEIDGVTPAEAEEAPIQRGVFTLLNPPEEAEATTPSEVAPMETPQAVEEAQNEVAGIKAIPKNEDGTINYDAIDDPKLYADTFADEIGSREEAAQEVANMRDNIIADIEALEKKKKKSKSASETIANKNAIESAKARVAFFDAVLNELTPAEVVEETTTPTEVAEEVAPAKAEEAPIQRGVFTLLNPPEEAEDAERRESVMDPIERAAMEGESTPTAPKTTSTAPVATTAEVGLVKNELSGKLVGRLQKTIDGLAKAMGVSVEFVDEALFTTSGKGRVNAKIEGNKVIISWKDRARAIRFLIGHEFTHRMKKLSTEAYEAFEKSVINALGEKEWNKRVERMRKAYEAVKESISENDLYEEVVADYVGDMAYSDNYFDKWAEANKEKHWLLEWVSEIWQKLADWFKSFGDNGMAQRMRDMHTKLDALVASAEEAQAEIAEREGTTPITSMTDAAANSKPAVQYSISTEGTLQEQIREYAYTKEGMLAGWTPEKVEGIIEETSALITALDAALRGNSFYDAFADRQPTIRTDWRDGQLKPTVTWTRANIEYKYDMSADLLCINNDGIESVLTSPSMVALMNMLTPAKVKDKNKVYDMRMTASDYTLLYDIMRSMGYVVPCKGCFDAAGRFKMLPSVAQKFIQDVNDAVDERNKDPKKFDAAVRKGKGKNTAVSEDGTPVTGATKDEAIRVAVMGDKLTHHLNWYDLITAEGQTNMLANHGGIFRAWQKTGAGRPKDKLLAEPYIGDITSSTTTIIGAYGDKTPSFRAIEVNQGTGLRRNSHSEFRPVLAVDEIQFMRDAFLRGLTVFKYMKELDDVRLFGKMGVKFNMSFFPAFVKGTKVAGLDANGNYIASEESVGAREFPYKTEDGVTHYDGEKGFEEAQKHINEDVSLSSVIFSIPHLIKAMTDVPTPKDKNGIWGSLIPFHSSGATTVQLAAQGLGMARANGVGHGFDEAMTDYGKGVTNFEAVQNDRFGEGWTIVAGKKADTKVEAGHKIEFANGNHYYNEAKGVHLFTSGYVLDSELTDKEKKALMGASKVAKDLVKRNHLHDFVVDYNDKVREIGTEYAYKEAADYYMGKLRELGLVPRFEFAVDEQTFLQMCEDAKVDPRHPKLGWKGEGNGWSPTDADSYYALFCDYGMTDPATGKWSPHRPVGVINENGERVFQMPENTIDIVKEGLERYTKTRAKEDSMNNAAVQAFADAMVEQGRLTEAQVAEAMGAKYSVIGEIGTLALDKAEEATTRLDDLNVARQMEERGDSAVETKDIGEMPEPDDTHTSEKTNFSLITPEMDADYLSAVERGDMEKAQQMVMEAAKLAMPNTKVVDDDGNPKVVYHQTNHSAYINRETGQNWDELDWRERMEWDERDDWDEYWEERDFNTFSRVNARTTNELDGFFFAPEYDEYHEYGERTIAAFLNIENPASNGDYHIDASKTNAGRDERIRLQNEGYDGVIREEDGTIWEYVAFNPNQIKSADPVTYDDAGNVIPLSERFNPEKEDIRYSMQAPSLLGVHNISLDKLRKVIKMGGLANPSVAVIDVDKQTHDDYGEYSLILPKNMVDARQGKNAGTWAGDAWTPTYPQVIRRMTDDKAISRFYKDIDALPEVIRNRVRLDFDSFMEGRSANALAYWYLFEKGNAPALVYIPSRYSEDITNAVEEATNGSFSMYGLTSEERAKCLDAYIAVKFNGDRVAFEEEMQARIDRLTETIETKKSDRVQKWAQDTIDLIKEYGFDYDDVAKFIRDVGYDAREKGKVNVDATITAAREQIEANNLNSDYDAWRDNLDERYGIEEYIFDGYTNSGNRRYLPHTVENASKWMKKQGRNGAVATFPSFGTFVAVSIPKMTTLESIRKRKALLGKSKEEYDAFREKWENVYYELGKKLQPDAKSFDDYGYWRLIEAVENKNPREFIKKQYGIELSEEDMTQLNEMLDAIRTEYPARYFETKFERPLQLSDFVAAVVPNDVPMDVYGRLSDANVEIFEYEKGDSNSRAEAMQKASAVENVRFSLQTFDDKVQMLTYEVRHLGIQPSVMVGENTSEFMSILKDMGIDDAEHYKKCGGIYLGDMEIIVVNGDYMDNFMRSAQILIHENTHSVTKTLHPKLQEVLSGLNEEDVLAYRDEKFSEEYKNDTAIDVLDEIISYFVGDIEYNKLIDFYQGVLEVEDIILSDFGIRARIDERYWPIYRAVMPIIAENITIQKDYYNGEKKNGIVIAREFHSENGGENEEVRRGIGINQVKGHRPIKSKSRVAGVASQGERGEGQEVTQYSLNTDMPFFEDNGDIVIFDELTAEEQKMARLEEAKALLDDNEDAQSIYDKTGWVYTEDGWEYFGEADIALNDNEKEKQRARRWLQAKRAVAKSRVRTMTKDLVDDIVAEERVKNEEEFAAIDEQNELREKNEKKLKYPLSEEAKAKIDELYKERNNTLAEIDKEYRDIFERFEADPKPYIQDYYASEAMMSDLDMFNGTVVKLKKSLDRAMRKIAQGKADRKSKMEATKAIKAQVNEMLRGELSRYTRKRDIVVLMDAVNEAKTVYQMLRAFNKAVETLYNIRLRKEMARMMSLTKMRLILNESGSSIDPQTYIKRMVADGVLTTAMAQNILNNYWRGVNSTGINIAKGVDADTVEVMTFIHKNVGLEGLAGKGVAEKIQELTDAVDKSNDSEAMKAMKMQAIAIIEDYLIAQMQMQSLKEIKNERDIEAEIARYSAEIAKLNNELINLEEQRDAIIETDKGFKSRKTAIEQKLKEIRTKYAEAVKQREQLDATYYGAMPDILKRMAEANESLELLLKRGHLRLSARKQAEVDHRNELVRMAVDDIDRPDALLRDNPKYGVGQKAVGSWVGKMVTKAYGSMEHMLRRVARNAPNGEGKLWHYFAKRLNNAYNNMIDAQKECADIVNGKCMELFGKKYNKVMQKAEDTIIGTYLVPNPNIANDKSLPRFKRVSPSHVEKDLSVAQALYIVSMWNQADGMATLIEQGFTEEKIEEIKEGLNKNNPKWLEFQKWVVGTFLPSRRGKYNDTHRMLFGADMDNVVNYYPIRRNMNDVRRNDDLSSPDFQNMPSTSTGSIIKRTNSKIKIDLEASFFGVLQEHIIEMEKWAEMAPVTKDFNALLSSKMVQTLMNGVGENFLEEFKNAAKVATLNYADHAREMEAILAPLLSRMWGAGLIGFKPYTALKQLTSSVLFFTHSIDPRFVGRFAFYLAGGALPLPSNVLGRIGTGELKIFPQGDWAWNIQWALQNSAMFRQRWESLAAGNEVFAKELLYSKDTSKFKKAITEGIAKLSKGSMALIALVDAYTSAAGMRAIYDDVYNTLIKDGATHEMAHEEALFRAELAVNKTQQSSQFMYLSPMQVSSDLVNTSLSAFQNAPIAQGRMFAESVAELVRNPREEARWIRHKYEEKLKEGVLAKEYAATEAQIEAEKAEGLLTTEEDVQRRRDELNRVLNLTARTMAERKAKKAVAKNKFKAGLNAVITGYLATLVFNLTAQLPYLLWGDDDDEKKKMLKDTLKWSFAGPLASVPLLGRLVNLAQGYGFELSGSLESFQKDLNSMADHIEKSGVDIDFALMALDFASRKGLGIDYKTIYSIYSGFEDMARNGYSKEAMMRAMVVPNSQVKLLVGERKEGETQKEYYTRIMRLYDIFTEEEYGAYFDEDGKPISDHAPQGMTKAYYKSLPKQWEAEYRKNVVGKRDGYAKLDALNTEEEEYKAAVEALGWTANKNPNNKAYEGTKYTPPIEGLTRSQYNTLSRKAKGVATKFKQTSTYKGNDDSKYYELLMAEMEAKKAFVEEYKKVLNSI